MSCTLGAAVFRADIAELALPSSQGAGGGGRQKALQPTVLHVAPSGHPLQKMYIIHDGIMYVCVCVCMHKLPPSLHPEHCMRCSCCRICQSALYARGGFT